MSTFLAISLNDLARIPRTSCYHGSSLKPTISLSLAAMAFGQIILKCILVKAKVYPSQCSSEVAHEAWIIAKQTSYCFCSLHMHD